MSAELDHIKESLTQLPATLSFPPPSLKHLLYQIHPLAQVSPPTSTFLVIDPAFFYECMWLNLLLDA